MLLSAWVKEHRIAIPLRIEQPNRYHISKADIPDYNVKTCRSDIEGWERYEGIFDIHLLPQA